MGRLEFEVGRSMDTGADPPEPGNDPRLADTLDVSLDDRELSAEVLLLAHLIIAVNETDRPLTQRDIDNVLGVDPPPTSER